MPKIEYRIALYKKQRMLLDILDDPTITEVLVEGSKGGGKTVGMVALAFYAAIRNKGLHIGLFRRTLPEIENTILREIHEAWPKQAYKERISKRKLYLPTRSYVSLNYLDNDKALGLYAGWSFSLLLLDESTAYTAYQINILKSQLRSATKFVPKTFYFTNPIGISFGWHKEYFVKGKEPYKKYETPESIAYRKLKNLDISHAKYMIRIHTNTEENIELMQKNPQYLAQLASLPDKERKALYEGSWDVTFGLFFNGWNDNTHITESYVPDWKDNLFIGCDWGTNKPFAIGWFAMQPNGKVIMYREYYGIKGTVPDEGCHLEAGVVAAKIIEKTPPNEKIKYMTLGHDCFKDEGFGTTIARIMQDVLMARNIFIIKAPGDRINGWEQVKKFMLPDADDGVPFFRVTKNCEHFLRTVPYLMDHPTKDGDLDERGEDHFGDCLKGFLATMPLPKKLVASQEAPYNSLLWWQKQKNQSVH